MLKRRIIATAILGASVALASFALVHARVPGTPAQSAQLATTAADATTPPFPQSVLGAPTPPQVNGKCALGNENVAPSADGVPQETTLAQLAASTDNIVLATAVRQVAYWQKSAWGNRDVWGPETMTEYHIARVVKGSIGPWWQDSQQGASTDLIPTCKDFAANFPNDNLTAVNHEYVLFLKNNPKTGKPELWAGSVDIFPVIGGQVYTAAAVRPQLAGGSGVIANFTPQPLDRFLAQLQGSSSP